MQMAANDVDLFVEAIRIVKDCCDAVDLNLGCPQHIARRGGYGAFMMLGSWDLIARLIEAGSRIHPVTVKIRVFEEIEKTVSYAKE